LTSAAVVWLRNVPDTTSDSERAMYGPRTPLPSARAVYSATCAPVTCLRATSYSAKP
jgi:hypothetical protein